MFFLNVPDIPEDIPFFGLYHPVSNDTQGTGQRIFFNNNYGSDGKLRGALFFLYNTALLNGPSLHGCCIAGQTTVSLRQLELTGASAAPTVNWVVLTLRSSLTLAEVDTQRLAEDQSLWTVCHSFRRLCRPGLCRTGRPHLVYWGLRLTSSHISPTNYRGIAEI